MTEEKILRLVEEANPANPLAYVRKIVSAYALDKMHGYIDKCHDCSSCTDCRKKSLTAGPLSASVMIISEAITTEQGEFDGETVMPLCGSEVYEFIKVVLQYLKVDEDSIFWMNAVNCFVYREEGDKKIARLPTSEEVNNCKTFVDYAVDLVRPKLIILLGNVAANAFRKEPGSMATLRGTWMDIHGIPSMITLNPDQLIKLRGNVSDEALQNKEDEFVNDMEAAFDNLKERYPNSKAFLKESGEAVE